MAVEKIKILGTVLELPAKQHCQSSPFTSKLGQIGQNWQCCLAGSSKTAPRILIFSIAMGADSSFYVKSIATYAPAFLGYNISVLARVFGVAVCGSISEKNISFENLQLGVDLKLFQKLNYYPHP